ncbi:MAG: tetratricopeptide repeat protein [Bryobacterales bacterium]|nr:tetratricopeptide repeat protein [Bryobacterales bacterium]
MAWCRISLAFLGLLAAPSHLLPSSSQAPGASRSATLAYQAKEAREFERAVTLFEEALAGDPANIPLRKDLAYTLLAIGRTERARDEFGLVLQRDPKDSYTALEYAFLCHETGRQEEAWILFRTLRSAANKEHRATATKTFASMDAELLGRIARLEEALKRDPGNYSSHLELARVRTVRNDFAAAATEFETAYRLKPEYAEVLLDLGSALRKAGDVEKANAVMLTASRVTAAFVAEQAKALLPKRYPYLSEFEKALQFDARQPALRREMGFFLLSLDRKVDAQAAFEQVLREEPADPLAAAQLGFLRLEQGQRDVALPLLRTALQTEDGALRERIAKVLLQEGEQAPAAAPQPSRSQSAVSPLVVIPDAALSQGFAEAETSRRLARKSYDAGFIPDAIRLYEEAHRLDPANFDTMLRLAWSLNMGKRDDEALRWFSLAARSPDPVVAHEAQTAIRNLTMPAPSSSGMVAPVAREGFVASVWAMPLHSTRWGSTFSYAQAKLEWEQRRIPVVPYFSLRFVGDTTGSIGVANPQFLSENSFIAGLGMRTRPWSGLVAWGEAGSTMAYLTSRREATGRFLPDYRGGISHFKLAGPSLLNAKAGNFAETMNDVVYIHRFDRDTLAISRNRVGRHLGKLGGMGGLQLQAFLNLNLNADFKRQAWANFVEAGPGIRLRWAWMPPSLSFTFSYLRGHHTIRRVDDRPNTYNDFQAGFWYAITR